MGDLLIFLCLVVFCIASVCGCKSGIYEAEIQARECATVLFFGFQDSCLVLPSTFQNLMFSLCIISEFLAVLSRRNRKKSTPLFLEVEVPGEYF